MTSKNTPTEKVLKATSVELIADDHYSDETVGQVLRHRLRHGTLYSPTLPSQEAPVAWIRVADDREGSVHGGDVWAYRSQQTKPNEWGVWRPLYSHPHAEVPSVNERQDDVFLMTDAERIALINDVLSEALHQWWKDEYEQEGEEASKRDAKQFMDALFTRASGGQPHAEVGARQRDAILEECAQICESRSYGADCMQDEAGAEAVHAMIEAQACAEAIRCLKSKVGVKGEE